MRMSTGISPVFAEPLTMVKSANFPNGYDLLRSRAAIAGIESPYMLPGKVCGDVIQSKGEKWKIEERKKR